MLTGDEIRRAGLITNASPDGYRASSYDVHIDQVITSDGELSTAFRMPPQGIVQVLSIEHVKLPSQVTGLATVKTGLCNEGLLALNIGIVDPGYEGRISSFLVNFSNTPRMLIRGEPFLRLQFVPLPNGDHLPKQIDDDTYLAERRRQAVRFGTTFLNMSEQIGIATRKEIAEWRRGILTYAGAAALVLAVLTFFLNWGSLYLVKTWLQPADSVRAELLKSNLDDQVLQLLRANKELNARMQTIESRQVPPNSPPSHP
jgi:deoxycytidine triphosphate deaminase